jgi:hypothetical protein
LIAEGYDTIFSGFNQQVFEKNAGKSVNSRGAGRRRFCAISLFPQFPISSCRKGRFVLKYTLDDYNFSRYGNDKAAGAG